MLADYRDRFPIFQNMPDLVYLDSAATSQRLDSVIDTMHDFSLTGNANVHRGLYQLSSKATARYEEVRQKIAKFLNANNLENIGFTKGTTESINIVAHGWLMSRLHKDDNIVVSILEHHANFLPWQEACKKSGAELRILHLGEDGRLSAAALEKLLDSHTKLVAITHISNTLGRVNPINELIAICRKHNIPILIDAAQSAGLHSLDVKELDCDFLAFSGHKLYGPLGTGVLYVSDRHRSKIEPFIVGGGMIKNVDVTTSSYREFPYNLEAGTPNVDGILGLGAAIDFLQAIDRKAARDYLVRLMNHLISQMEGITEVTVLPFYDLESGIISLMIQDIHPHDVAGFLDRDNIAVRAGMHCTQPLMNSLDLVSTIRVSVSIYNKEEELNRLVNALKNLISFWK
jgi:cysteine desulfurase/selenocysteine lyase